MGQELRLEFGDVESAVSTSEEWQRRYREFRLILMGLVAGILATIPAQLLVEPLDVTSRGIVTYGGRSVGVFVPTPGYVLANAVLVVVILLGVAYGYRYVTGYYENPTLRINHEEDPQAVYDRLRDFLQQEADDLDVALATTNQLIECRDAEDTLVIQLKFDSGRSLVYLTYNPRNEHSRFLIRRIRDVFGERA